MFGGDRLQNIVDKLGVEEDDAIEAGMLTKTIENAQKKVEGRNFGIRKYVLQYDDVMNKQREIIYAQRRKVLSGENLRDYIMNMIREIVNITAEPVTLASRYPEEWDFDQLEKNLRKVVPAYKAPEYSVSDLSAMTKESLCDSIFEDFEKLYEAKEEENGSDRMREVERMILLRVVDNLWMDHIDAMDQLREGIGLRALGQEDPVAAYAKEGFDMFEAMVDEIRLETVNYCYNVTVETDTDRRAVAVIRTASKDAFVDEYAEEGGGANASGKGKSRNAEKNAKGGMPESRNKVPERETVQETYRRKKPKVGRNDPCPCGSGKKYKNCCMNKDLAAERQEHAG